MSFLKEALNLVGWWQPAPTRESNSQKPRRLLKSSPMKSKFIEKTNTDHKQEAYTGMPFDGDAQNRIRRGYGSCDGM